MNDLASMVELQDMDLMLGDLAGPDMAARWRKLGFIAPDEAALRAERDRLLARCERRWVSVYERSLRRYGRGLTPVRGRVCQGCFVQLPTSAAPPPGETQLHVCESCGRLLLWRQPPLPGAAGA